MFGSAQLAVRARPLNTRALIRGDDNFVRHVMLVRTVRVRIAIT